MTERPWRGLVSKLGAVFLGAILVVATIGKIGDPVLFVEQIRKEGLDFLVPAYWVALLALVIEMGLGMALLLGIRHRWILWSSGMLVAFFVFLTGRNYYLVLIGERDPAYDCGCFGVFLQRSAGEAFWQDLFLLVPPLVLACLSPAARRMAVPIWKSGVAAVATLAIAVYTMAFVDLPRVEPVLATVPGTPGLLQPADHFAVWVDGIEQTDARVLESDLDLRLAVWSGEWERVLLLDIRTTRVWTVASDQVHWTESGDLQIPPGAAQQPAGDFAVGAEGLSLEFHGRKIQIRTRS